MNQNGEETFGMLYIADVKAFEGALHSEIELFEDLPEKWTYPLIQPLLLEEYARGTHATASCQNV